MCEGPRTSISDPRCAVVRSHPSRRVSRAPVSPFSQEGPIAGLTAHMSNPAGHNFATNITNNAQFH